MIDLYRTIESPSEGIFKAKGSKFIALASPVDSEENIKTRIADLKKQYHDARHHCFAWRLGPDLQRYRINDDGEPSGSAGQPIFGQIQSRELTDLLVVVVRYFGGKLLGVGGLINAYRSAASGALDHARIVERRVMEHLRVGFGYGRLNDVMRVIKELHTEVEEQSFELNCTLLLKVWVRHGDTLRERLGSIPGCTFEYAPAP